MKIRFAFAFLAAAAVAQAADDGLYKPLEEGNCTVWTAADDRRFLRWTGDCRDGKAEGQGVLTGVWKDANGQSRPFRYEGRLAAGKRSGFARSVFGGASEFTGTYRGGALEGWAMERTPDGTVFEGQWHNGLRHGIGTLTHRDGSTLRGRWVDGNLAGGRESEAADGKSWSVITPQRDGTLAAVFRSGAEYEAGTYRLVNDTYRRHGPGVFLWEGSSKIFLGEFADDVPNGPGTFVAPDKGNAADASVYGGVFQDGCLWRGNYYTNVLVERCKRP